MDFVSHPSQQRHSDPSALDDPILNNLERYWRSLRHAQQIPTRTAIDPSQIDTALPYAFILQRVAPGTARFRVAGQRIYDLLKMDARGMPFSTLFQPEARDDITDLIEAAFGEPAIIGLPLVSAGGLLQPEMRGAVILLPMQDDAGVTNRMLGAIVTPDATKSRARRFAIDADAPRRHETLGIKLAAATLMPKVVPQRPRPDASLQPALRLVVNNG